jgi:Bacteriophage tail sheath protein
VPVTLLYPGVYIEELPSSVRTITGVATSITAFIGRAARGPVDEPITITSYADFERRFGGLWRGSVLGFAVRDFFQNGGSQAIVARLYKAGADPAKATIDAKDLQLEAATEGGWGNKLRARIDMGADKVSPDLADLWKPDFPDIVTADLFNLTVRDTATGVTETFLNVTAEDSPRRVDHVLENESQLVRAPGTPTVPSGPHDEPDPGADIWADDALSSGVDQEGSDGDALDEDSFTGTGNDTGKKGLYALENADLFNLLCIPPYLSTGGIDADLTSDAAAYCEKRRAMLIVDPPGWSSVDAAKTGVGALTTSSKNAAVFFPMLRRPNPLADGQVEDFVPCGAVAGIFARTDTERGVWKAPAGQAATIVGAPRLSIPLTDGEIGQLNPLGVNCLRTLPAAGRVVWGARTLQGNDRLASEWKYIPVRRTALYIEESLYRGTQWVVFEPNDEPLWSQIRLNVGAFMHNLFLQGAFQGKTPQEAYLVKCNSETTTQNDINLGVVNILVGFAPLKPAEFVVIRIQQLAGQVEA